MFRIGRHIKEAFVGLFRHIAMTLSSISTIIVVLIFVGVFLIFSSNIEQFTFNIEETVSIHVKVAPDYEGADQLSFLESSIESIPGVTLVTFSSKDQELDKFIESFGEDGTIFESYRGEINPLRMAFLVDVQQGSDVETISNQIRALEGIEAVQYGGVKVLELMDLLSSIRNSVYIFVIALGIIAIFLISNTIKLSIATRSTEISIMRTVGAKNSFIRIPFLLEGILIGLIGSILPIGLIVGGYIFLYDFLGGILITPLFELQQPIPLVLYTSALLVVVAVMVGLLGSYLSVRKYLRWKR